MIGSSGPEAQSSSTTTPTPNSNTPKQSGEDQQELKQLITQWEEMTFDDSAISSLVNDVNSTDIQKQHYGVIGLRKLLSKEQDPLIQEALDSGVVPALIQLVQASLKSKIQFEAAWCLTNLCSATSEQASEVIDQGVIPCFISGLKSPNDDVVEQCLWGLGNLIGDSAMFRDLVIEEGAVEPMVAALEKATRLSMKRNGIWALSNICREKPAPKFARVARIVPFFCEILKNEDDPEIVSDLVWGLFYCSEKNEGVDAVLSCDVTSRLVDLLSHSEVSILSPCLAIIGNIISGSDEQTGQVLKEEDLLPNLLRLTENYEESIRKETFWILSNIAAGPPVQFESVMGNLSFVKKIIHSARNDSPDISREAAFTLSNSTTACTPAQIIRILENGVFNCLVDLLYKDDVKTLLAALEGIGNCLKWGKVFSLNDENGENKFRVHLEKIGAIGKLEELQDHPSDEVYKAALRTLEDHFQTINY